MGASESSPAKASTEEEDLFTADELETLHAAFAAFCKFSDGGGSIGTAGGPATMASTFDENARLESDKLCRRLIENAAAEAQLVSKVLADEAQFQQDRRASFAAPYAGAATHAAASSASKAEQAEPAEQNRHQDEAILDKFLDDKANLLHGRLKLLHIRYLVLNFYNIAANQICLRSHVS